MMMTRTRESPGQASKPKRASARVCLSGVWKMRFSPCEKIVVVAGKVAWPVPVTNSGRETARDEEGT